MTHICRVCGNSQGNATLLCHEKMFGSGDSFPYFQCGNCRCLQIASVPESMERFYPPGYYSYNLRPVKQQGVKARLGGLRDFVYLKKAAWLESWLPQEPVPGGGVDGLAPLNLRRSTRILDVGCGSGRLLSALYRAGFKHLLGIEPFLPADVQLAPGLMIRKQSLEALDQQFDVVMFHHVLEHLADGKKALECAVRLLRPGGKILVRVPTVDSAAWETYRENWVSLDAPRHFYLHSWSSLALLAGQAGLAVERCWSDAGGFQFWGSELYKSGKALFTRDSKLVAAKDHFTADQLQHFELEARALNRQNRGDQFAAILTRAKK
jgi:SAM-dependent methyltransferase